MSTSTSPSSTASPPFDNADADVILRSSNGVDFRVFKLILSLASPVFKAMFSLPQPSDSTVPPEDSPPIIELPENNVTLEAILLLCYPATDPTLSSMHDAWDLAAALVKYDMETVMQQAKEIILSHFLENFPISHYALGCHHGWRDVAERAATETLKIKDLGRTPFATNECERMDATTYQRLISYHMACGVAAENAVLNSHPYWTVGSKFQKQEKWMHKYKTESGQELRSRPSPTTLYDPVSPSFLNAVATQRNADGSRVEGARQVCSVAVRTAVSRVMLEFKP